MITIITLVALSLSSGEVFAAQYGQEVLGVSPTPVIVTTDREPGLEFNFPFVAGMFFVVSAALLIVSKKYKAASNV